MDHLSLPLKPLHPPLEVRMLDIENYDGGDFTTYPERQGWGTRTHAEWQKVFNRPPRAFIAFLERWLLFGFMDTFFGRRINTADFVRYTGNPAYPVLTTKFLPHLLQQFVGEAKRFGFLVNLKALVSANAHLIHILLMRSAGQEKTFHLELLSRPISLIKLIDGGLSFQDPRAPEMAMATSIVMESLVSLFTGDDLFGAGESPAGKATGLNTSVNWHSLAWTQLREDGWCPSELVTIFHRFHTACFHFLHNLPRPGPHEKHQMIRIHKGPTLMQDNAPEGRSRADLCTPFKCAFKQLQDDKYKTKHANGCPGCDDAVADPDKLCEILSNGNIPLILSIGEEDEKADTIMLVEAEPGMAYVAISHVWSDGMGNLRENALPRCQLLRLSNMVRSLSGEDSGILLFWVDTICVPPDAAGFSEAQQRALTLMRKTYEDATAVLVLDSWLFNSSSVGKSHEENLIRIFSCNWNTRLWTYQEGVLAKVLYFQFSDAAYNLDRGIQQLCASEDPVTNITLKPLKERYHDLRGFRKLGDGIEQKILAIATALCDRTTSVASDEPLCLAVLLDLDVSEIARTEPDLRMEKFWRMLPSVPNTLVFTFLATLRIDGLRWAPLTFLRSPLNKNDDGNPIGETHIRTHTASATPTCRGLTFQAPGLRFAFMSDFLGHWVYVRDENSTWHRITVTGYDTLDRIPYEFDEDGKPKRFGIRPWNSYGCHEAAIIDHETAGVAESLGGGTREYNRLRIDMRHQRGVLVAIREEKDGTTYCQKLSGTFCTTLNPVVDADDIIWLDTMYPARTAYYGGPVAVDGTNGTIVCISGKTCTRQRWCVG
jgi:Heterokaryon incompatibility protein (HET)